MEEAPTNPDEAKKQDKISLPKKLWEAVDTSKQTVPDEVLSDIPLDYEADDATPDDSIVAENQEAASSGAVSAGDILAERYAVPAVASGAKSVNEQRGDFEQHRHEAEAELDKTFEINHDDDRQEERSPEPSPEIAPEDMPETYFERRHEVKDEPGSGGASSGVDDQTVTDQALGLVATSATVQEESEESLYAEEQRAFSGPFGGLSVLRQGIYWQAIKGGFLAAIAIIVALLIIAMVS